MPTHESHDEITANDAEIRDALAVANIPTLQLVLAYLTGDRSWLHGRYQPSRTIAMNDNDTAGLPDVVQDEIRDAALRVIGELRDDRRSVPGPPTHEQLIDLLSASLGEAVPAEYGRAMAEDGGFSPPAVHAARPVRGDLQIMVIGAGMSGVCVGSALRRLGVELTIIERNEAVGGTWLENRYPGARVDTPSHLYSFSFAPKPDWSHYYAKQAEILDYLQGVARDEGLLPVIQFGTEVVSAAWDERTHTWNVLTRTRDGVEERHRVDVLISSVGQFNQPSIPHLPGLDSFTGPAFHTARWDHSAELAGKRVGVIGSGASSVQVVPAIADTARSTLVFQRSPQWISPNPNYLRDVDPRTKLLMHQVPSYRTWYRFRLTWMFQDKLQPTLQKDHQWPYPDRAINATNDKHRIFFTKHLRSELAGREDLVQKTLPDYPPYGKRMLLDTGWFRTLRRDDVELVPSAVTNVDADSVTTAEGERYEVDVLVLATGFTSRRMLYPMDIRGRSGRSLRERWGEDDADAYLGITVPDFPNFFLLYGPNTNLGHGGSTMFHAECQTNYILTLLAAMSQQDLTAVEVREDVCADYLSQVDAAHENMIWTHPGMSTYYRNAAGRVVTNTPWRLIDYWAMTRKANLHEYRITGPSREQSA